MASNKVHPFRDVPPLRWMFQRRAKARRLQLNARIKTFALIKVWPVATRRGISPCVAKTQKQIIRFDGGVDSALLTATTIGVLASTFGAPLVARLPTDTILLTSHPLVYFTRCLCALVFMFFTTAIVLGLLTIIPANRSSTLVSIWLTAAGWMLGAAIDRRLAAKSHSEIATVFYSILVSTSMLWIATAVLISCGLVYYNRLRKAHPFADTIDDLLICLSRLESRPNAWLISAYRQAIARNLLHAAKTIETHLCLKLATGDPEIDIWTEGQMKSRSRYLRELARWIIHPGSETRLEVLRRVANFTFLFASGDWSNLPRTERSDTPYKPSKVVLARAILHTTLVAFGPFIVISVVQVSPFRIGLEHAEWLRMTAVAWAVVSLIIKADPGYAPKFDLIQRLSGLNPFNRIGK